MKILFVCSSNICRSPYAEFVFRKMVDEDAELKKIVTEVKSAAVLNKSFKIDPKTVKSLLKEGFSEDEIYSHKPRFIIGNMGMFKNADVIIGMSKIHRLLTPCKYKKKYMTLSEAATGMYVQIPDPFLIRNQSRYDEAMQVIKGYLAEYAERLKNQED